ncbi:MAG: sigma-70 family RNA polymerase sigma factor [Hyphomicrobiales bacterium]|nr:MAG: sigma-70 family RNA polymerase sigma factor [Hyphomicrobiales bacterium]
MGVLARKKEGSEPITWSGSEGTEDEAALLARIAEGEADAFRLIVDRHLPALLGIARRMLRDEAEAEDLAQEALLRLWRNAGNLEIGAGGVRPWLRRVVSNLCIDRVRAAKNTSVVDTLPEVPAPATQVRHLAEQDLAQRVDAVLKSLPERQRLALTLFHYEGMSQIEVGEVLGVSDEAVESLLARARRTLKAALKDDWQALMPEADLEPPEGGSGRDGG